MTYREFQSLVQSDLYRYDGARGTKAFLKNFVLESGFRYCVLLRACGYFRTVSYLRWGIYHLAKFWFYRLSLVLGVHMDPSMEVGPGFYIGHAFGIIINRRCRIGENCTIAAHVTLGRKSREPKEGCPTLGNRVYVGTGAVIIGAINIGDDAAVGANAVLTKDVPAKGVVAGIPAVIISDRGSEGYVAWQWSPPG
jgi:serine O-acetyltransferase